MAEATIPPDQAGADWFPSLSGHGPRYLQIAEALEEDIRTGQLAGGARLPDHRTLSQRLQVTTGTVSRGYGTVARKGLIVAGIGRGTYVAPRHDAATSKGLADLSYFSHSNPDYISEFSRTLAQIARDGGAARVVDYQRDGGAVVHREAGAHWFREFCGLSCKADEILLCNGTLHGLASILSMLAAPGDVLLTEQLTYTGLKFVVGPMHLRMQGVAMDADGLIPEAFEEACKRWKPSALLCVSNYHNPTTAILPLRRRRAIAEIAERYQVPVIEDDVYGPLIEEPLPLISSFIPSLGYVVSGASKALSPGLRVGFIRVPSAQVAHIARGVRANFMTSPLLTEILARMIHEGTAAQMISQSRSIFRQRLQLVSEELRGLKWQAGQTSPFIWLQLPAPWRSDEFAATANDQGVLITPAEAFAVGQISSPHAVRITLATGTDVGMLQKGLKILRSLVETPSSAGVIFDLP